MIEQFAIGAAVKRLRKAAKMTQPQLAELSGIDQSDISRIENGKQGTTLETIRALAKGLGIRPSELFAEAEAYSSEGADASQATAYQLTRALGVRYVPLISWVEAGRWSETVDSYARGTGEDFVRTEAKVGRLAYALRVSGSSMTNSRGEDPTFPDGTIIIVDPHRSLENNALIISRAVDSETTTFKRYVEDGERRLLVPLNTQYLALPIDREMVYCGTVVAKAEVHL